MCSRTRQPIAHATSGEGGGVAQRDKAGTSAEREARRSAVMRQGLRTGARGTVRGGTDAMLPTRAAS